MGHATKAGAGGGRGAACCRVLLSAGEASGDWAGALLAQALRARRPGLHLVGIGGRRMAAAGVALAADSSSWGAIGALEALSRAPRALRALRRVRRLLASDPPDALVLINCGAVNVPLARLARRRSVPTLYYFPPGSWSRKPRGRELRDLVDVIATPFRWSHDLLEGGRARVQWVGHPVVEAARPRATREEAYARYGLDPSRPAIALAPGSRAQELRHLLPTLAGAARLLAQRRPGLQVLAPIAPALNAEAVLAPLRRSGAAVVGLTGMDYDALQMAGAAAVCSGTATLEFACLGIPMVVVYRASWATAMQYRLVRGVLGRQRFAAMPNIVAQRAVAPELLGSAATPRAIAGWLEALLADAALAARMREGLAAMARELGPPGASGRTAELVLELVEGSPCRR